MRASARVVAGTFGEQLRTVHAVKYRHGFTVVEVLVAIVLLSVGLLGLMSTAVMITRLTGEGQRYVETTALAVQQLERLRSEGCGGADVGSWGRKRHSAEWRLTSVGRELKRATLVVTTLRVTGTRVDTFLATIPC